MLNAVFCLLWGVALWLSMHLAAFLLKISDDSLYELKAQESSAALVPSLGLRRGLPVSPKRFHPSAART